ncbi:UTRA domain-containing protein [Roseitalea sp. MMSF_3504]|uniref:UTRA domain-containing protein n=1 Tax=Roseitalea sp. MMSF_3504 TaxID=3046716 RepID=UPI00273DE302|nr:UTRA domain-containing protein [Roseitalea sp. MMSF_3504]
MHATILNDVRENIISGTWPPGYRIPFEAELAKHYGCSRMTVNKALTQLTRAGFLVRSRKAGTYVKAPQSLSAALEITNIRQEVEASGRRYGYRLLQHIHRTATREDHDRLDDDNPALVHAITCLHEADDRPFCYELRLINPDAVPSIDPNAFQEEPPGAWLLRMVPWSSAEHQIVASAADDTTAKALDIAPGTACLEIQRKTMNEKGRVTWTKMTYPGDKHRLIASFSPGSS